jgi:lactoylglutathione lyase
MEFYEKNLGLELGMIEQARRVAFYWIGGRGKTVLGLWEKPPWASEKDAGVQIITQHFAFEIDLADLGRAVAGIKQRGIELRNFFGQITDVPSAF